MTLTLDVQAEVYFARWARAVDLLWRTTVLRRRLPEGEERRRAERRARNLQRIVRRALADYHRIELERQRLADRSNGRSRPRS